LPPFFPTETSVPEPPAMPGVKTVLLTRTRRKRVTATFKERGLSMVVVAKKNLLNLCGSKTLVFRASI
jgi:hypothetical protein